MTSRMLRLAIVVCALGAFGSAQANSEQCSGGANGGMDATGNECSDPGAFAVGAPLETAAPTGAQGAAKASQHPALERVAHQKPRAARHRTHAIGAPQRVSTDTVIP